MPMLSDSGRVCFALNQMSPRVILISKPRLVFERGARERFACFDSDEKFFFRENGLIVI